MAPKTWGRKIGQLLVLLLAALLVLWPTPVWADASQGAQLFANHCAGCHRSGGNIIRRGKTLKLAALERQGLASAEAIAAVAARGQGQMSGYETVIGEGGPEAVAAYVWAQAQAGWPPA